MIRLSTSSFFRPPAAEYIRTADTAAILDAGVTEVAALGIAKADRVATGRATTREAARPDRRMAVRNISTVLATQLNEKWAVWGCGSCGSCGCGADVDDGRGSGAGRSIRVT